MLTSVVYPILPRGELVPPILVAIVGGTLVGALFLIESTVADVVDDDEVRTGLHREGLYFGLWRMGTKLSRALGLALSGWMLAVIDLCMPLDRARMLRIRRILERRQTRHQTRHQTRRQRAT